MNGDGTALDELVRGPALPGQVILNHGDPAYGRGRSDHPRRLELRRVQAARHDPALAVLEGFHAVKHALRFGAEVDFVLAVDPAEVKELVATLATDLDERLESLIVYVDDAAFGAVGPRPPRTHVVAVAQRPSIDLGAVLADPRPAPVVLLEDPRNLANLGACVRVAAAADAAGVLTTGTSDPWHPDALRGGAGLQYALPVARIGTLPVLDRPLVAVDPDGAPLDLAALDPRSVLAFGTERYGLSDELLERADAAVRIPMRAGVSSLNLATSVAAVLYAGGLGGRG